MSFLLDMICAVILILFVFIGIYRGVFKFTIMLLASVVCCSLSLALSDMAAENAYNKFVKKKVVSGLETACRGIDVAEEVNNRLAENGIDIRLDAQKIKQSFDQSTSPSESISKLLVSEGFDADLAKETASDVFADVKNEFKNSFNVSFDGSYLDKAADQVIKSFDKKSTEIFYALSRDDPSYSAELLEKNLLRSLILPIVRITIFIILYIIMEIGVKIILFLVGVLTGKRISTAARVGGGALGAVKGIMYCLLIGYFAAQIVAVMGESNSYLSLSQCSDTILFKYFFRAFY